MIGQSITDALLNASIDLPEVTQAKLPSAWRGAGLSNSKNEGVGTGCTDFRETDIKFLADNGFNFARVFFSFSTLRFPDYPADGRLVNENELRDLDQLVAWGMKYGVHIQLSMCFFQDEGGNSKADGSIAANDAQWAITNDYWTMLARRYAGIPSKYLNVRPLQRDRAEPRRNFLCKVQTGRRGFVHPGGRWGAGAPIFVPRQSQPGLDQRDSLSWSCNRLPPLLSAVHIHHGI